jgi:hypothetical protein
VRYAFRKRHTLPVDRNFLMKKERYQENVTA